MKVRRLAGASPVIALTVMSFGATAAHADVAALALVTQSFNVAPAGTISLTVRAPNNLAAESTGLSLAITAYRPIADRDALDDAIAGDLNRNIDTVEVSEQNMLRPATDQVQVVVPVEVTTVVAMALVAPALAPVALAAVGSITA